MKYSESEAKLAAKTQLNALNKQQEALRAQAMAIHTEMQQSRAVIYNEEVTWWDSNGDKFDITIWEDFSELMDLVSRNSAGARDVLTTQFRAIFPERRIIFDTACRTHTIQEEGGERQVRSLLFKVSKYHDGDFDIAKLSADIERFFQLLPEELHHRPVLAFAGSSISEFMQYIMKGDGSEEEGSELILKDDKATYPSCRGDVAALVDYRTRQLAAVEEEARRYSKRSKRHRKPFDVRPDDFGF